MRMKGHPMNITFVQVYAPTADSSEKAIEEFYEMLHGTLDNKPKKDVMVLMGDWNAKIGKFKVKTKKIWSWYKKWEGDRLEEFCMTNNLIVGNSMFQHHPRILLTWMRPGDGVRNQIDYILIGLTWKSALQNVKTLPGADCGRDHQLLLAKMKLMHHQPDMMWRIHPLGFHSRCEESLSTASAGWGRQNIKCALVGHERGSFVRGQEPYSQEEKKKTTMDLTDCSETCRREKEG